MTTNSLLEKIKAEKGHFVPPRIAWVIFAILLLSGIGIRLFDLTDLPLDFHSTRQLHSALIARGMYYETAPGIPDWQRQEAVKQWKKEQVIEPQIMEFLAAQTYRLAGGDYLWIPRLYAIFFWCLGAVGLFLLVRKMVSYEGAIVTAGFYLLLPYGAFASRSFQPESLMIMMIIFSLWAFYNWVEAGNWRWAVITGALTGLAVFVKSVAVFPLAFGMIALLLARRGLLKSLRDPQTWTVLGLTILPSLIYYIYGVFYQDFLVGQFSQRFFPALFSDYRFYVRWYLMASRVIGLASLALGLLGIPLFLERGQRAFVIGLFIGYLVYGAVFPYHISSHDYYQLPLIPIVAIALASLADLIARLLMGVRPVAWARLFALFAVLLAAGGCMWEIRDNLKKVDYRPEAAFWADLARQIDDHPTVALLQDYGYRMEYWGWMTPGFWPASGDIAFGELGGDQVDIRVLFERETAGKDYFLVTMLDDLDRQPEVKKLLYDNYTFTQGKGYVLFDLRESLHPANNSPS